MRCLCFFIFFFLCIAFCKAQQLFYPINHQINYTIERHITSSDYFIHTAFKPLLSSQIPINIDSILYPISRDSIFLSKRKNILTNWFWRKLRTQNFIRLHDSNFYMTIDPLFNFEIGDDINDTKSLLHINTRGIMLTGTVCKKVSFYSTFHENQGFFPDYLHSYIKKNIVVPGQGRIKPFKKGGYDYAQASGYVSFTPYQALNIQFGRDKHFIGSGYRSLLLSDNSLNYPFLRITTTFKRWQYTTMLTSFQHGLDVFTRKHGSYNFLNLIINKNFQLGILEAVLWKTTDSTIVNKFNINYFNPILFVRTFQYNLNHNNNILLGLNIKAKLTKKIYFYGQTILDQLPTRYGFQLGAKWFDVFTIKNLYLQTEYNYILPYTYSHNLPQQNYSCINQPLAHPLGANFSETIIIIYYKFHNFFIDAKINYAITGADTSKNNFGGNIFISNTNAKNSLKIQGLKTQINNFQAAIGYLVNPNTNMQLYAGVHYRTFINNKNAMYSTYFFIAFKTSLINYYYDF